MKIDLYGDSTQVGVSVWGGTAYLNPLTPAIMLQMLLDRDYGAGTHQVTNLGIGGSTLASALTTALYPSGNILQSITARQADIVVANFGINDAYISGITGAAHKGRYETLRNHVLGTGAEFVFETTNPTTSNHDATMVTISDAVKTISGIKVCDVRAAVTTWYPQWSLHMSDPNHPNGIMYMWIGSSPLYNSIKVLALA